nr:4-alpha-glucanotransferase [uncultured Methanoregula sp.]
MTGRGSGILLPVFSLPTRYGIGDLGAEAYRFVDFLAESGQKYWQILPLNPTMQDSDNSPYLSSSAFAGNTNLISPERMVQEGFLDPVDIEDVPAFPPDRIDYELVIPYKRALFSKSYEQHARTLQADPHYHAFCREQSWWLDDYAVFISLAGFYGTVNWSRWPDAIRSREKKPFDSTKKQLMVEIEREKYLQYMFFRQWRALHKYSQEKRIAIIGDMPLYVNADSADVWTHPELFRLDGNGRPAFVAGVPPDYFSRTGQMWKNPLYRWEEHERTGFSWWIYRFRQNFSLFDLVRIDHFRGLVAYWEIPAGAADATGGRWVRAPADRFLKIMKETFFQFPAIAEDLGIITPDVHEVMRKHGLPGMRVLQFAFTDETAHNPHAPHNLTQELFLYTGTHDNPPVKGWFGEFTTAADRKRLFRYLGRDYSAEELPDIFIRLAMSSVAGTVIIPVQDLLGCGSGSRVNTPGTDTGNWCWRMPADCLTGELTDRLLDLTRVYGRA